MNPALDVNTSVQHVISDRKLSCETPRFDPGGGGVNVARVLTRLGCETVAVYPGGGSTGELLESRLKEEGVPQTRIRVSEAVRQNFIVAEKATGRQFRFDTPGAELKPPEIQNCVDALFESTNQARFLVLSGSLPPGVDSRFYARISGEAKERGWKVVVDTSGEPLRQAVDAGIYMIKPNRKELSSLAGVDVNEEPAVEEAAAKLVETGRCEVVLVSLAGAGVMIVSKEGAERLPSPAVQFKSAIGAGDSLVGGLVCRLAQGESVSAAARYGVAAGAAAVRTEGTDLCRKEDVERLYNRLTR